MPSCADLIQLLQRPSSSLSEQQEAAAALATLPMTPQVWSVAVGALPRLVELMQHPDSAEGVREQAKRALHHISDRACRLPNHLVQAASSADLFSLVQLLLHVDVGFVQSAVMFTLGTLAEHAYNRGHLLEAGAIGRLVQLLRSSTQEVQLSAARALRGLSREPNVQALFLSAEGALASLIRLLRSSSVKVQQVAVSTLAYISTSADGEAAIVAAGAIPPIVHLLKSKAAPVQEEAARALSNLGNDPATNEATQISIAEAGALPPLILMLKSKSETVQIKAAAALNNLSSAPVVQARVGSAGAVAPLANLLKSRSAEVRKHALCAVHNLSLHPDNIKPIFAAGAIGSVVPFLNNATSPVVLETALKLLANLTTLDACHVSLITAGVVPHLVTLLSSEEEEQQCMAATALCNLASEDTGRLCIVAAGAIDPLAKLLTSDSEEVQVLAVTTLGNLIACKDAAAIHAKLESSGAPVAPLVSLLQSCESGAAREEAIQILLVLSTRSGSHCRAIAAAGGIPPLFRIF